MFIVAYSFVLVEICRSTAFLGDSDDEALLRRQDLLRITALSREDINQVRIILTAPCR